MLLFRVRDIVVLVFSIQFNDTFRDWFSSKGSNKSVTESEVCCEVIIDSKTRATNVAVSVTDLHAVFQREPQLPQLDNPTPAQDQHR